MTLRTKYMETEKQMFKLKCQLETVKQEVDMVKATHGTGGINTRVQLLKNDFEKD